MILRFRTLRSTAPAILIALAMILSGCKSLGPASTPPPSVDRAQLLAQQGDNAGAARIYESLAAESAGTDRVAFLLSAARAYLAARDPSQAERVIAGIQPPLTPAQSLDMSMLNAELALARGDAQQAWQLLASLPEPTTAPAALRYLELRQRVAFASGRPLEGVRAQMQSERWLTSSDQRRASRATLLGELRDASEHNVSIDPRAAADVATRGWLELAPIAAEAARNPAAATAAIESWRSRYPNHPADEIVRSELLGARAPVLAAAPHVALLLPLSGRQASAAISVRDGFLTAYYVNPSGERPRIRVYDTSTMGIADAVGRAREEGAEFIVGPLTREEVVAAAELPGPRPPILALNFLPSDRVAPTAFYQFALSPEDEARQAARRILADGNRHGIALVPAGDWGTRVLAAFKDELIAGGGTLIESATFDASQTDYAAAITDILRIDDSTNRHRRLESVLGTKLQFQPRRRGDIGFIFAASQAPATARLLRPQLRFYFAGDIPTYSTSDAFEPDPNANQDMDGLIFPDGQWMLGGGLADSVRAAARDSWGNGGPRRNRLFAFGFDAYRLASALRSGSASAVSVDGLTGRLSVDSERRVHRELDWAQLHQGQPRLLSHTAD